MSDIYLQITETPTVVTLSAPVVSGALASTVTVANTVTVALDSNSLSALENVTVTVGAAITGTVTVSNFPASQAVTFSAVTISNFPSTQPVSIASVTVGNTTTSSAVFVKICGERQGAGPNETTEIQTDDAGFLYARLADPSVPGAKAVIYDPVAGNAYVNVRQTSSVTIGSLPAISGTVTASINNQVSTTTTTTAPGNSATSTDLIASTDVGGFAEVNIQFTGTFPTSATITPQISNDNSTFVNTTVQTVTGNTTGAGNTITATGMWRVVLLGARYFRLRVTAAASSGTYSYSYSFNPRLTTPNTQTTIYSGTQTIQGTVTIGSLPAISGTVTANTFALQGTAVTTSNFTSTTASTVLANYNATREVLTIFNEGAGNLHICAGETCTTIAYQVRLSAGDYYEVPNHQTTITHSAVFATAGTARIVQIS